MTRKQCCRSLFCLLAFMLVVSACGNSDNSDGEASELPAQIETQAIIEDMQAILVPLEEMALPQRKIIGFGEATHGNKEFTQLKQELFSRIMESNGCKVFAIEGDFGGGWKVNQYLLTGEGSAEEAATEIGFAIYRTREMADLIRWMREYNTGVAQEEQIRFYGFDMQRYDNSKEGLFEYLSLVDPDLVEEYTGKLANLNDETVFDQSAGKTKEGLEGAQQLEKILTDNRDAYIQASSEAEYELAAAFCTAIIQNATLRGTNVNYGNTRDQYMAEKVQWILDYEARFYGRDSIFIAGHNGHIEKTSRTMGISTCMGEHLAQSFGDEYYAIGSEFTSSRFLAPDNKTGERREFFVENRSDTRLAVLFGQFDMPYGFLDLHKAGSESWNAYLREAQPISAIGEAFQESYQTVEGMQALSMIPAEAFDAMVLVAEGNPSTMLS